MYWIERIENNSDKKANMNTSIKPICTVSPTIDFSKHLRANDRILFSGAFGIGKTFFLKHFFSSEIAKDKYNVFHLFPVNYQIAANEDVFELIKYDILYHLLGFGWKKVDNNKFSKQLALQSYLMDNSVNIISKVLKCVPVLENVGKAIETLSELREDYLKHKDEIAKNDTKLLKTFYEELKQKKGSIHEFDAISEFIYDNLTTCNDGIDKGIHKENVLIIDDLDRIDPEHIFRLLNVFSAHVDIDSNTNKFGFNKIIFVCDVENIKNIFAAKYGQHTDFKGYIDKFYSSEIFYFNNKVAISEYVYRVMNVNYNMCSEGKININSTDITYITNILLLFVERSGINLRQILTNVLYLNGKKDDVGVLGRFRHYCAGYTAIWVCLKILGGQKDSLISAFERATPPLNRNYYFDTNNLASIVLPLLTDDVNNEIVREQPVSCFQSELLNTKFEFIMKEESALNSRIYAELVSPTSIDFNTLKVLLIEATNKLYQEGLLD